MMYGVNTPLYGAANAYGATSSSACCQPQQCQPQYQNPCQNSQGISQQLQTLLVQLIKTLAHQTMAPVYQMAKQNPVAYGLASSGLSLGVGMMTCPYAGMMMAGAGAMGYMQAQQQ